MHRTLAAGATGLLILLSLSTGCLADRPVKLGIDVLIEQDFAPLAGKRVGLITNATGLTSDLRSTADILHQAPNVELVALFGPEHGVRGEVNAGDTVEDSRDEATGVPVYSLYGKNRRPTPQMLADIDVLVFDIQDIGSRSYTFISTMAASMESAAACGKPFIVLDRPNPLGGERIEGRILDLKYKSFVGYLPIPYVHGLTVGELAQMINGEGWLPDDGKCQLAVIPMKGWKRDTLFEQTGLTWVSTSPHVPRADTALFYASTGIMGELQVISEGVGVPLPFELAGMPEIEPQKLAAELNARGLPGVFFRPCYFTPYYTRLAKQCCGGVQIHFTDRAAAPLTSIQFHIMDAVKKLYPETQLFGNKRDGVFDKVCGTERIREMFEQDRPIEEIITHWQEGTERFRQQRAKYLLYE